MEIWVIGRQCLPTFRARSGLVQEKEAGRASGGKSTVWGEGPGLKTLSCLLQLRGHGQDPTAQRFGVLPVS